MNIVGIPALTETYENYIWIIHHQQLAWVVDPGESAQVIEYLSDNKLELQGVLITHGHADHINGLTNLLQNWPNISVYTPTLSAIQGTTHKCAEGDQIKLHEDIQLTVLDTPGHTLDHIAFYNNNWLFCGDTLFAGGCGRILGGSAQQFADSILKLRELPDNLEFYSAHEYTQTNLTFATIVEPENSLLSERLANYHTDYPAILKQPQSSLTLEKATNPFLRFDMEPIKSKLIKRGARDTAESLFLTLREWKDEFDRTH